MILTQCDDKSTEYCNCGSRLWDQTKGGSAPLDPCQCCRLHICSSGRRMAALVERREIPCRLHHDCEDNTLHLKPKKESKQT